jgi:hypothetical protein
MAVRDKITGRQPGGRLEVEQQREMTELELSLIPRLRGNGFVEKGRHVFQYLILPSFEPLVAWDVLERGRRGHPNEVVLVRTCWRKDIDYERMRTPVERMKHEYPLEPTIELHELPAPSAELELLASELRTMRLPLGGPLAKVTIVDGTMCEVAIEQSSYWQAFAAKCRLTWHGLLGPDWAPLKAWVERAEAVFDRAWQNRGEPKPAPHQLPTIDDAAARHMAKDLFHAGQFGRAAELLADVSKREVLTAAEIKMLQLAVKRNAEKRG